VKKLKKNENRIQSNNTLTVYFWQKFPFEHLLHLPPNMHLFSGVAHEILDHVLPPPQLHLPLRYTPPAIQALPSTKHGSRISINTTQIAYI
jgi:hypothetical protein